MVLANNANTLRDRVEAAFLVQKTINFEVEIFLQPRYGALLSKGVANEIFGFLGHCTR